MHWKTENVYTRIQSNAFVRVYVCEYVCVCVCIDKTSHMIDCLDPLPLKPVLKVYPHRPTPWKINSSSRLFYSL